MVVMSRPPASTARMVQEQTGSPWSQTVQAEQAPRLQPIFVPVNPSGPAKGLGEGRARLDLERTIRAVHPGARCRASTPSMDALAPRPPQLRSEPPRPSLRRPSHRSIRREPRDERIQWPSFQAQFIPVT